jgi:hypothetical protein
MSSEAKEAVVQPDMFVPGKEREQFRSYTV